MIVIDSLILLIAGLLLGGLFIAAAIAKLIDFGHFQATLGAYLLIPERLAMPAASALIAAELAFGAAALVTGVTGWTLPLAGIAALLALYAGAMAINLRRGRDHIDCGCLAFGARRATIGWSLVVRNLLLALVALTVALPPVRPRELIAIDWISAAGGVIAFMLLYQGAGLLLALRLQARKG
jgi:hypothetical protein